MLVFDDATIHALDLQEAGFLDDVKGALVAYRQGDLLAEPKRTLISTAGAYATGTHGLWPLRNLAFFHNLVGLERSVPGTQGSGYRSIQTLFRLDQARPVLVAHGSAISGLVPVVVSCLAAQVLCDLEQVRQVGLIGAGLQARLHLQALARMAPIRTVRVYSRSAASIGSLKVVADALGLQAVDCDGPRDAVEGADLVVSSISDSLGIRPFLDLAWLKPGALLASVDMLRPWFCSVPDVRMSVVVDEMRQALHMASANRIPREPGFDLELAEFFGAHPPPLPPEAVRVLMHPGCCASLFGMALALLRQGASLGGDRQVSREGWPPAVLLAGQCGA